MWLCAGILLLAVLAPWQVEAQARRFRLAAELAEVSGLAVVAPDSLWWHNDSGDQPRLYLTDGRGQLRHTAELPVRASDWEDLTRDNQGRLYVGDFGDNRRQRQDLRIYRYDPHTGQVDSILFAYPGGAHYDLEACVWWADSLHLFTKDRLPRSTFTTYHLVLAAQPGQHQAVLRDSLVLPRRVVTAAALRPDGGQLALVAYYYRRIWGWIPRSAASVFFLDQYPEGHFLQGRLRRKRISCVVATQYESVDYLAGGRRLLVASEKTAFIRARAKRVRARATAEGNQ